MSYQELIKHLATENLNERDVEGLLITIKLDSIEKIKAKLDKGIDFLDDYMNSEFFLEWACSMADVHIPEYE
ncbi:MAG TPA: hypothetical protein DCS93_00735 [Microscillaceae bacterium]|nr:hypothetical protein [Microscillaceae bacterium]